MKRNPITVLIIDDDEIFRFIHKKLLYSLSKSNFELIPYEAINGFDAIQLLKDIHSRNEPLPDVILLDLNMPVLDGFGFIQEFQKLNFTSQKTTNIVVVSSSENLLDKKRCCDSGINRFLSKPINIKQLELEILQKPA